MPKASTIKDAGTDAGQGKADAAMGGGGGAGGSGAGGSGGGVDAGGPCANEPACGSQCPPGMDNPRDRNGCITSCSCTSDPCAGVPQCQLPPCPAGKINPVDSNGCTNTCQCVDADAGAGTGNLHWFTTCGDPVCGISPDPFDDPNIPNCTTEKEGQSCTTMGQQCDGVAGCGATLICTDRDPTAGPGGCPISRARYKQDIAYLDEAGLRAYRDQVLNMPLASYHYRSAPSAAPQLGFIIEDIEPSVAVSGDHVNLYGYLSMAVAAIQVQQNQIEALERETRALRAQIAEPDSANANMCTP